MNLVRAGFGEWILIDNDILLPHNLARHTLSDVWVGYPKAWGLQLSARTIIAGNEMAKGMMNDVLKPYPDDTEMKAAFGQAQLILDTSASVAVARHLALDVDSAARRVSFFLSPSGRDLVMLAEPASREMKLDFMEMQYYRHLLYSENLATHLLTADGCYVMQIRARIFPLLFLKTSYRCTLQ